MARLGARTLGIDASESNIGIASAHARVDPDLGSTQLAYRNTYAEELVKEPRRYDVVCSMEVLEHVDNPAGFLETCAELVKVCAPGTCGVFLDVLTPLHSPVATFSSRPLRARLSLTF